MQNRMAILDAIGRGDITVEEGLRRLNGEYEGRAEPGREGSGARKCGDRPLMARIVPLVVLWGGVVLVAVGGLLEGAAYGLNMGEGWRIAGWVFLGLGVVGVLLGEWLRTARWLAIRAYRAGGRSVSLAVPMPLGLTYWTLRCARAIIPGLRDAPIEQSVLALDEAVRDGRPFSVEIQDGIGAEHVQVYMA